MCNMVTHMMYSNSSQMHRILASLVMSRSRSDCVARRSRVLLLGCVLGASRACVQPTTAANSTNVIMELGC